MTVRYAWWNVKYINTVVFPDDGHIVARNMYRKEINILRKIVHQVAKLQDYTGVYGQQNKITLKFYEKKSFILEMTLFRRAREFVKSGS
jgi:hypothetical protein